MGTLRLGNRCNPMLIKLDMGSHSVARGHLLRVHITGVAERQPLRVRRQKIAQKTLGDTRWPRGPRFDPKHRLDIEDRAA